MVRRPLLLVIKNSKSKSCFFERRARYKEYVAKGWMAKSSATILRIEDDTSCVESSQIFQWNRQRSLDLGRWLIILKVQTWIYIPHLKRIRVGTMTQSLSSAVSVYVQSHWFMYFNRYCLHNSPFSYWFSYFLSDWFLLPKLPQKRWQNSRLRRQKLWLQRHDLFLV